MDKHAASAFSTCILSEDRGLMKIPSPLLLSPKKVSDKLPHPSKETAAFAQPMQPKINPSPLRNEVTCLDQWALVVTKCPGKQDRLSS